jgi:2-polyprenyl-3-methyl-5-hydroxy-6-metoxy-1,4-benzoquinol methylase
MAATRTAVQTVSEYNRDTKFTYELRESRLKKCVRIIDRLSPGRMLDIGCSTGDWSAHWQSQGWQCAGIDIDRAHVEIASHRGIDARYCDLNRDPLPFEDQSFDLIFAGEVIEHLVDTDAFLQELHRCLRPGGSVLITTPNLASFENRLRLVLGIYPIWLNYNLAGSGHVRAYTPGILKKQLRDHGFRITRHKGNWVPFIPQHFTDDIKQPWLAFTGDLFPSLAMDIIMLAERTGQPKTEAAGEVDRRGPQLLENSRPG